MAFSRTDLANQALGHLGGVPTFLTNVDTDVAKEAILCKQYIDNARQAVLRMHPWNFAIDRKRIATVFHSISSIAPAGSFVQIQGLSPTPTPNFAIGEWVTIGPSLPSYPGVAGLDGVARITGVITPNDYNTDIVFSAVTGTFVAAQSQVWRSAATDYLYRITKPANLLRVLSVTDESGHKVDYRLEGPEVISNDTPLIIRGVYDVTDYTLMDTLFYQAFSLYLAWLICYPLTQSNKMKDNIQQDFIKIMRRARHVDSGEDPMRRLTCDEWVDARDSAVMGFVRDPMT